MASLSEGHAPVQPLLRLVDLNIIRDIMIRRFISVQPLLRLVDLNLKPSLNNIFNASLASPEASGSKYLPAIEYEQAESLASPEASGSKYCDMDEVPWLIGVQPLLRLVDLNNFFWSPIIPAGMVQPLLRLVDLNWIYRQCTTQILDVQPLLRLVDLNAVSSVTSRFPISSSLS